MWEAKLGLLASYPPVGWCCRVLVLTAIAAAVAVVPQGVPQGRPASLFRRLRVEGFGRLSRVCEMVRQLKRPLSHRKIGDKRTPRSARLEAVRGVPRAFFGSGRAGTFAPSWRLKQRMAGKAEYCSNAAASPAASPSA